MAAARRAVVSGANGRVLELGVGVGANWQYLPEEADYSGVEPDEFMVERARRNAAEQGRTIDLHVAPAEALPFPDETFDTVIVTLTLCSVSDLEGSLSEARRVLKPGGELRFWEHVRPSGRLTGLLSDAVAPAWKRVGAGCHMNRRTAEAVAAAGFEIASLERSRLNGLPSILGVAVKQAASGTPVQDAPA
jgi:ubiquinone/menaquinone biosynthesis C-methylase UbiE